MSALEVRRGSDRPRTTGDGVEIAHSFSFGAHYDPDNVSFGMLLAVNDTVVRPGCGFPDHAHAGLEIVSWVVSGSLRHHDDLGGERVISSGYVQYLSTGPLVRHAETNAGEGPLRFVQMWLPPHDPRRPSGYRAVEVNAELDAPARGWVPVASGLARHADQVPIRLNRPEAGLSVCRIPAGGSLEVPLAAYVHLLVTRGLVRVAGGADLADGDAARLVRPSRTELLALADSEVLAWEMDSAIAG